MSKTWLLPRVPGDLDRDGVGTLLACLCQAGSLEIFGDFSFFIGFFLLCFTLICFQLWRFLGLVCAGCVLFVPSGNCSFVSRAFLFSSA